MTPPAALLRNCLMKAGSDPTVIDAHRRSRLFDPIVDSSRLIVGAIRDDIVAARSRADARDKPASARSKRAEPFSRVVAERVSCFDCPERSHFVPETTFSAGLTVILFPSCFTQFCTILR